MIPKRYLLLLLWTLPVLICAQPHSSFYFVQLADPQFGMYPFQKDYQKERRNLSRAVEGINSLKPDFVVICGDIVNRSDDSAAILAFRETMQKLDPGIPVYLVPGNHDIGNAPSPFSIDQYRKNFGPDYYSFVRHGFRFFALNTSLIKDPSHDPEDAKSQLSWLKSTLDSANSEHSRIIVFQHHPWFVRSAGEPNGYFNIPRKTRMQYLKLLAAYGVEFVFAGHLHANSHGHFGSLTMITSGPVGMPLGTSLSGIRIVTIGPHKISHKYYELRKIPRSVRIEAISN